MKVVIQHPSGAVYQGSNRYAVEWWERFSATHPTVVPAQSDDEEAPAVVGLDGNWSGPQERRFEHGEHNQFADMPIVNASVKTKPPFGFVRNEENAK